MAKRLKKNGVAVDVVAFGSELGGASRARLEAFVAAVNSAEGNSHFVAVDSDALKAGGAVLSDAVLQSPICAGGVHAGATAEDFMAGGDGGMGDIDPELALALRLSREEEEARQARVAAEASTSDAPMTPMTPAHQPTAAGASSLEDDMLQRALTMSMANAAGGGGRRRRARRWTWPRWTRTPCSRWQCSCRRRRRRRRPVSRSRRVRRPWSWAACRA